MDFIIDIPIQVKLEPEEELEHGEKLDQKPVYFPLKYRTTLHRGNPRFLAILRVAQAYEDKSDAIKLFFLGKLMEMEAEAIEEAKEMAGKVTVTSKKDADMGGNTTETGDGICKIKNRGEADQVMGQAAITRNEDTDMCDHTTEMEDGNCDVENAAGEDHGKAEITGNEDTDMYMCDDTIEMEDGNCNIENAAEADQGKAAITRNEDTEMCDDSTEKEDGNCNIENAAEAADQVEVPRHVEELGPFSLDNEDDRELAVGFLMFVNTVHWEAQLQSM